uniref:ABC transporter substrate-binding protein n=1 Tax=Steinernema glaseri TaxID=37863 RepID=A0A1I8AW11_9BILA
MLRRLVFFVLLALALVLAGPIEFRSDSPLDETTAAIRGSISGSPVIAVVHGDSSPQKVIRKLHVAWIHFEAIPIDGELDRGSENRMKYILDVFTLFYRLSTI